MKRESLVLWLFGIAAALILGACTTEFDHDAYRADAVVLEIGVVTSDELYPTAGDEIDWKMLFVPSPGDLTVTTFWDTAKEIFAVEVGVYDRFGIPIKVVGRPSAASSYEFSVFLPESGLHYIKLRAESGQSIYSLNTSFVQNYEGFEASSTVPRFEVYSDFGEEEAKVDVQEATQSPGVAGGLMPAPGGGVALPVAGEGGVALPTAASGGIASPGAQSAGPTIVAPAGGGATYVAPQPIKVIDTKAPVASTEKPRIKPIVGDIKGPHVKIEASALLVTSTKTGARIKLSAGRRQGVREGAVGDIYVDGAILEGGRFKMEKVNEDNCFVLSNAPAHEVKKASSFVIKSPN
ncbi:MAG: hypothetical protein WC966_01230 [Bradymonadales bacterium]|jgi:hypothetical protein